MDGSGQTCVYNDECGVRGKDGVQWDRSASERTRVILKVVARTVCLVAAVLTGTSNVVGDHGPSCLWWL